jgi:hypothetical protein
MSALPVMAQSHGANGFYLETNLFPVYVNRNDTRSVTSDPGVATESGLGYDTRTTLGYTLMNHSLLVGVTYNLYHLQTKRANVEGGDSGLDETTDNSQYGPTLGWLPGNWRFLFTYFMSGKKSVASKNEDSTGLIGDVTITNTKVSGYQLVAGYTFQVSNSFGFGPSVVYRALSYSKQSKVNALNSAENYDDVDLASNSLENSLTAMLSLIFQF